jgi:hypothetical protein
MVPGGCQTGRIAWGRLSGITKPTKKLKASYVNVVFGVLRLMLKQAVKRHIIPFNPADNAEKLTEEPKQVEILAVIHKV